VPNRKIVFDNALEEPGAKQMVMTVTFDEGVDGRTTLTWHTLFASVAMRDEYLGLGFEQGGGSGLDQLADVVRAMAARG
jgi:uncharacterized protein YndB with AHSA1/START domain